MYIDSNIFVYAATDVGRLSEECKRIIHHINTGPLTFIASFLVLDEVIWTLKKKIGKEDAIIISKTILSLPIRWITVHRSIMMNMIEIHERSGLDPRDALHVSSMKEFGVSTIISEDSDFDRVDGIERLTASEYLKRFEPSEIL